jgi:hypothetical protein
MTLLLIIVASAITGTIVGGWLTMVLATAAMSRSQEHMENKVRYWQERARLARLADEWAAHERRTPEYWPGAATDAPAWAHRGYDRAATPTR